VGALRRPSAASPERLIHSQCSGYPEVDLAANLSHRSAEQRTGYIERVIRGGFPESVARTESRRERFLDSYVADIVNRDVIQLSEIDRLTDRSEGC
jgi:predicted AAA+ superfamily ATPase